MTTRREWDVKLTHNSIEHKLRLLNADNKKVWQVSEVPPQPQIGDAASSRAGFSPDRELPFAMEDWSWGVGLDRFGTNAVERGHIFRYADGFGIDTSEPGFVKHGPLLDTSYGAVEAGETILQFILFADKVYVRTTHNLYNIQSGTLTLLKDFGAELLLDMEVFGDKLYIAVNTADTYYFWEDGGSETSKTVTGGASHFLATQGSQEAILIRVYSDNKISSSIDPTDVTTWDITSKTIGNADTINTLFTISGFAFAGTESTIFLLAADSDGVTIAIELDKRLAARRSTNAFKIKAESGSDCWLSDGGNVIRVTATGFESYEVQPDGPFRSYDDRPFNSDIVGTITSMTQDIDAVFICVDRGSDIYIYKGVHLSRGTFAWTPFVKYAGSNAACGVFKTTGDSDPKLYVGNALEVESYVTENWTTDTATWELHTSKFTATLDTCDKLSFSISAFLELSGPVDQLDVSYHLANASPWNGFR